MSILREYLLHIECISKFLLTLGHSFRHSLSSPTPYSAAAVFYISYCNNDFCQWLTHALVDFEGIDGALRNNLISHQFDLLSNSRVTRYFCLDLSLLEYLDIAKDWRVYCTKQCCPQCRDQPNDLMCPASC